MAEHVSVLLEESVEQLKIRPNGIYLDGTLGLGGHSAAIASRLTSGILIGIDRDETAIERAGERLKVFGDRVRLVHGSFAALGEILDQLSIPAVDGMIFDLGVSSPQLDEAERGFSYRLDAPLDMRMDRSQAKSAWEVVNRYEEAELSRIFFLYGEERYARRISAEIVRKRREHPVNTTMELAEIIRSAMPAAALREKQHPAKRSFQALRIAVNDELGAIADTMEAVIPRLNPGGRLCVITFHSLEDRIVKVAMAEAARGCTCPPEFPVCVCGNTPKVRLTPRKPMIPSANEISENPRARSAKLRVCEKC